ncbi:MAG TPA: M28 family peptidase, partial [Ignavibacteriaceae bacterium]|nr:M28 family peptidase [Ignavibacteriaceae bacterium]
FKLYLTIIFILLSFSALAQKTYNSEITSKEIQESINFLASDKLEGRFTGSDGAALAVDFIKKDFQQLNLKPLFNGSYTQSFPFISSIRLTGNNSLEFHLSNFEIKPKIESEFITAPFSGKANVSGDLVFAGYGISAPDLNYDDYAELDVTGKTVVILRYNPEGANQRSEFEKFSPYRYKAKVAREKGAVAVIFVTGFFPKDDVDKLMEVKYDGAQGETSLGIVQVKRSVMNELFKNEGLDLLEYQKKIDESKNPASFVFKNVKVNLSTEVEEVRGSGINIGGILEGNDPLLKDQYIVIGAHYDHLGWGTTGSLYRGTEPKIHNGADDNASGTAAVLELAEKFASIKDKIKRSIIFISFAGEELGLLGSAYYADHSVIPIKNIISMLNLDMVGRLKEDNNLIVYGTGTSSGFKEILNNFNKDYNFNLTFNDEGFGPSDQSSFYAKEIPVLFFFTDIHSDYHRPTDTAEKINSAGEESIVKYVYDIAVALDNSPEKPDYINVPRKNAGRSTTFRVYVGTIPDFSSQVEGFKLSGVSPGGPAQKAGLQGGDIMIEFGGKKISNIYDFTYALGDFNPGDIVEVVVMRNNEKKTFKVELGAR